jgi:serralysin
VFKLTVPQAAFRHVRSDARITLSAALPDGSALPTWATFDATRNILSGTAPEGVAQLDVEVTAVDEEGYQISVILNLKFSKNP